MTTNNTQLRGHCQRCGRQQAVRGAMAAHGYTVQDAGSGAGWFRGVCSGHNFRPVEQDRAELDAMVEAVLQDCTALDIQVDALRTGRTTPATIACGARDLKTGDRAAVPFAEAPHWEQRESIKREIYRAEGRARAGRSFAAQMTKLANQVHGHPLQQVQRAAAPAPILTGEMRMLGGRRVRCIRVSGQKVHAIDDRGFLRTPTTRAWRAAPAAPAA